MSEKKLKPIVQIIMTPIIDVIMIMLLFFMIAYSRSSPHFYAQKVEIPKSSTSEKLDKDKKNISIAIDKDGNIIFDKKNISLEQLKKLLIDKKNKGIDKVTLRGDKNAPYFKIIVIIDHVKESGIKKVLLLTKKKSKR